MSTLIVQRDPADPPPPELREAEGAEVIDADAPDADALLDAIFAADRVVVW